MRAYITFSRLNLNDDQLNLSQQENGLAGADMAAVATNFAQAQIASQATINATAQGSKPAHAAGLPKIISFVPGFVAENFRAGDRERRLCA